MIPHTNANNNTNTNTKNHTNPLLRNLLQVIPPTAPVKSNDTTMATPSATQQQPQPQQTPNQPVTPGPSMTCPPPQHEDIKRALATVHLLRTQPSAPSSSFSPATIESVFQLHYGRTLIRDIQVVNALVTLFILAVFICVLNRHAEAGGSGSADAEWDGEVAGENDEGFTSIIYMSIMFGVVCMYDAASIFHVLHKKLWCRASSSSAAVQPDLEEDGVDGGFHFASAGGGCDQHGIGQSGSKWGNVCWDLSGQTLRQLPHFVRYLQSYTFVLIMVMFVMVLLALASWEVHPVTAAAIHPVFSMLGVIVYACCLLHLSFRLMAPLSCVSFIVFALLLICSDASGSHLLLYLSNLLLGLAISLHVLYHFEAKHRSHFLLEYALMKEQSYIDHSLNNLLPKDVVLLLKKQNPRFAAELVSSPIHTGMKGRASGGGVVGAMSFSSMRNNNPGLDSMRMSNSVVGGLNTMTPRSRSRGLSLSSNHALGSGVASRFAMHFPQTTVFESDIVGYTKMVSSLTATETLNLLNLIFSRFDQVAHALGVEKIETIGDAFMVCIFDGPPDPILDFALTLVPVLAACNEEMLPPKQRMQMRMGICTGSCFGGIVGTEIPRFHLFGSAHDIAIHIEQHGRPSTIITSSSTQFLAKERYEFDPIPELVVDGYQTFVLKAKRMEPLVEEVTDGGDAMDKPTEIGTEVQSPTTKICSHPSPASAPTPIAAVLPFRQTPPPSRLPLALTTQLSMLPGRWTTTTTTTTTIGRRSTRRSSHNVEEVDEEQERDREMAEDAAAELALAAAEEENAAATGEEKKTTSTGRRAVPRLREIMSTTSSVASSSASSAHGSPIAPYSSSLVSSTVALPASSTSALTTRASSVCSTDSPPQRTRGSGELTPATMTNNATYAVGGVGVGGQSSMVTSSDMVARSPSIDLTRSSLVRSSPSNNGRSSTSSLLQLAPLKRRPPSDTNDLTMMMQQSNSTNMRGSSSALHAHGVADGGLDASSVANQLEFADPDA